MRTEKPTRTLVVGDLHGGLKALRECLVASEYNQAKDRLVFLGNYVGILPESSQLIESLLWLETTSVHKPIFLKGSNDSWCGMWLNSGKSSVFWLQNGGSETARNYIRSPHLLSNKHAKFFVELRNFYVDESNKAFVNSGFLSSKGLGHEVHSYNYFFCRDFWKDSIQNPKQFEISKRGIATRFRSYVYDEVFIGNLPTTENRFTFYTPETSGNYDKVGQVITNPMKRRNIWNVNTGVAQGYPLTIMDVNTKQFWQSQSSSILYPNK